MNFAQYRLYLNGTAATRDQLARFEDITIEQEMDKACYGRFQVPVCVCANGVWSGETDAFLQGMSRIRLELQIESGDWVPLIDGPIVNVEGAQLSEPGQSTLTLVVSDDSFYLHRDETVTSFEGSDDEAASQIFDQAPQIASMEIDAADAPSNPGFTKTVLRGTQMEFLQRLAKRQHMHAYVTAGSSPGQSVGHFKKDPDPKKDYGLAPMVLLGTDVNIFSFHSTSKAGQAATFTSGRVNLKDRSTDTQTSNLSDVSLAGSSLPPGPTIKRLLRPGQEDALTLARAVQGASERSAYALRAKGEVMKGVYTSVLQPYQYVQVRGANGTLSGTWLLRQVTHTITRNSYGQSFQVTRNAVSSGTNSALPGIPSPVF